jgi:hypothetical protein
VFVRGNADYDNVVIEATRRKAGGNGGNGDGKDALSSDRLRELLHESSAGTSTATLVGKKRLLVRVNCPRKVGPCLQDHGARGAQQPGRPPSACAVGRAS